MGGNGSSGSSRFLGFLGFLGSRRAIDERSAGAGRVIGRRGMCAWRRLWTRVDRSGHVAAGLGFQIGF